MLQSFWRVVGFPADDPTDSEESFVVEFRTPSPTTRSTGDKDKDKVSSLSPTYRETLSYGQRFTEEEDEGSLVSGSERDGVLADVEEIRKVKFQSADSAGVRDRRAEKVRQIEVLQQAFLQERHIQDWLIEQLRGQVQYEQDGRAQRAEREPLAGNFRAELDRMHAKIKGLENMLEAERRAHHITSVYLKDLQSKLADRRSRKNTDRPELKTQALHTSGPPSVYSEAATIPAGQRVRQEASSRIPTVYGLGSDTDSSDDEEAPWTRRLQKGSEIALQPKSYPAPKYTPVPESIKLSTDEWKGKKVVLFSVPGAFTPTCHAKHLPGYIEKYDEFKAKGVDVIAVLASNDAFVMSGWGRAEGVQDKARIPILTLSDNGAEWSKSLGLSLESPGITRTARYAIVIDDLKVTYFEVEQAPGVTVSGADAVLAKL
ncbi:hypothetical protein DXG03_006600 [Asterophora parasitica]|uniref:Putative peroxiredoxin n=1 Tax=Asterophora parasitica TaxID=117018 RepID=A0A9P7G2K8_9AGAR|nr:hypothetical protein DXG03_006600 [Asterophora parasitica]